MVISEFPESSGSYTRRAALLLLKRTIMASVSAVLAGSVLGRLVPEAQAVAVLNGNASVVSGGYQCDCTNQNTTQCYCKVNNT